MKRDRKDFTSVSVNTEVNNGGKRNTVKPRAPIVGSVQIRGHSVLPQKSHAAPWGCGEAPKAYVNLLTDI